MASKKTKAVEVKAGDYVLLGSSSASYPAHWYSATVLFVTGNDLLIERHTANGQKWREHSSVLAVRAVGTISELNALRTAAANDVKRLWQVIADAETELQLARDAMWKRIEQFGEGIFPPDFVAIDAEREARAALMDRADEELRPVRESLQHA